MALELRRDRHRAYRDSSRELRRTANAAFFERIDLTQGGEPTAVPTETFASLVSTSSTSRGLNKVADATYSTNEEQGSTKKHHCGA